MARIIHTAGACVALAALIAMAGGTAARGVSCPATPAAGCIPAATNSIVRLDNTSPAKDKLLWKWAHPATPGAEPPIEDWAICVYAGTAGALLSELDIPGSAPGWTPGFPLIKYQDKNGVQDGVQKLFFNLSAATKQNYVKMKAKGQNVPIGPAGPLSLPVTIQGQYLNYYSMPTCVESVFSTTDTIKNDSRTFKAKN